jgi:site-specific DNA-methyltransferase (adenine-specific)/adenine-specific DNA-methyltransferase
MIELDKKICQEITAKRLENIVQGYIKKSTKNKKENVSGIGGGSKYCFLGETLFDSTGQIQKTVSFIDLARFVFLKETGLPITDEISGKSPLIGTHNDTAIYLLYNGVLGDKTPQGGNALTRAVLADLPSYRGSKVVYGTSCRVGMTRLKQENVIFRQIPYELKVD